MIDTNFINWLKPHVKNLYGSHKNMGLEIFNIKAEHHRRKIDYIFETFKGNWGCIEFEHGDQYGEITSGAIQLDDFYRLINKETLRILINGKEIKPTLYLLATKYSKIGYLYKNDTRIIETIGYSTTETLNQNNNSIFHATRWMWRFCGRDVDLYEQTNPIGVKYFSVLFANKWNGKPTFELNGKNKYEIDKI